VWIWISFFDEQIGDWGMLDELRAEALHVAHHHNQSIGPDTPTTTEQAEPVVAEKKV